MGTYFQSSQFKEKNSMFELVIESLPYPFYVIDAKNYKILLANSAAGLLGKVTETTTCYELTHNRMKPCEGTEHKCPLTEVLRTKKPVIVEHIHYDANGNPKNYEIHAFPIFDQKGEIRQMIEYSLDITERKQAEESLQQLRDDLENQVKVRTAELSVANKELLKEIRERKAVEKELHRMASEMTLAEEKQRRQIAADLHDGIGQSLAMFQIRFSEAAHTVQDKSLQSLLNDLCTTLEGIIQDSRTLTFKISPPLLYEIGLEAALEWLADEIQKEHKIEVFFKDDEKNKPLDEDKRTIIFRTVREVLFNSIKHARATRIDVSVKGTGKKLKIEIKDDGIGFDPAKLKTQSVRKHSMGILSLKERLDHLDCTFHFYSKPDKGTRVMITAPLQP